MVTRIFPNYANDSPTQAIMHQTTYDYIFENIRRGFNPVNHFALYNGNSFIFAGCAMAISNTLEPTIMEPEWVFPKERFVSYESKDIGWAKFFGIGRPGIQQIGPIYFM